SGGRRSGLSADGRNQCTGFHGLQRRTGAGIKCPLWPALRGRIHAPDALRDSRCRKPHFAGGTGAYRLGGRGRGRGRNGDGGRIGWTGGRRSAPLPRRGRWSERRPIQIPRGALLAVVLDGATLLAIAGAGLRSRCRFGLPVLGFDTSTAGPRSLPAGTFSCRRIFLSSAEEGKHR